MRVAILCLLLVTVLLVDAKKSFSTRRKSGGSNRRGQTSNHKHPPPAPATPHRTDSGSSSTFLNSERAGSSSSGSSVPASSNTHYRGNPFDNHQKQHQPAASQPAAPHTNGPIGFEKVQNQGGQKIGFDKVNSEVQHRPAGANVPSAPAFPASPGASYPGKPSAPNGPPPAYPGQGSPSTGTHGGYEPPPAYPGRPVNAPPVYSANAPNYAQRSPGTGGYPQQNNPHPQQNNPYPQQNSPYPQQQWSQPGQQPHGYPGSNFGGVPNQGYQQGYGSYPNGGGYGGYGTNQMSGGYGQSYPGYGGNSYGGSPFGQSNPYGGSPFSSPGGGGFGGGGFGGGGYGGGGFGGGGFGGGYGNQGYSPNNFGYSSKPGLFGSLFGGGQSHSPYGYHKRSRFGGLPIPIPIPIPIPLGGFGMFGGRSHNHRVLDTFIKNQTINESDNSTAVYVLNNATFTPCTTDQFIYDSLNVTVMSCTAENCTAIKVFTTTNVAGALTVRSAGITMCMENDTTYSSFADNVNPTVHDLHKYVMRLCKEVVVTDTTGTTTEETSRNVSVKITQTVLDESVVSVGDSTTEQATPTQQPVESSTIRTLVDSTSASTNTSACEIFNCSSIEMCLPTIEIVDHCTTPDCPFTRTGYHPCITVKMCKSPTTPISTFATLNNTLSKIDEFNNITSVNDVANLTLISYIPPVLPLNCSETAVNSSCPPLHQSVDPQVPQGSALPAVALPEGAPVASVAPEVPQGSALPAVVPPEGVPVVVAPVASVTPEECAPGQLPQSADGTTSSPGNGTLCTTAQSATSTPSEGETTSSPATTVID